MQVFSGSQNEYLTQLNSQFCGGGGGHIQVYIKRSRAKHLLPFRTILKIYIEPTQFFNLVFPQIHNENNMQIKTKKKLDQGSKMHFRYSAEKTDSKICTNPRLFSIKKNWGGGWHEPSAFALGHENPLRSSVRAMQFLYGLMMFAL